ncbi:MAG: GNAT family N-acetyltransferase [bacterium]|nr:GNAT family N-acetyltransferase [bacterium]
MFEILRATPDHLDLVAPMFDGYRQFYQKPSDLAGARQFISERLTNGDSVIFLAVDMGAGLGFTQLYPSFSSVSMKRLWVLNDLFVAEKARGQGVASALLDRARQHALETGAKGLMLETAADNLPAQRLYERLGWVREAEFYVYNLTL